MRRSDGTEILKYGIIALAPDCNQDCLFCFETPFRKRKKTLSDKEVKEIADSLAARGFTRVVFIGGEATVIPEFPKICRYITNLGITVCLTTNGRKLANEYYVKELFDSGLSHIEFSIHSHVPEDADYLSSRKDTALRQKAALENIQKLAPLYNPPPTVNTNTVLTTVSAHYLPELIDFITTFNSVKAISLKYPTLEGRICDNSHLIPRYSDLMEAMLDVWKRCESSGRKLLLDTFPLCVLPPVLLDKIVDFEDRNSILEGWNHEERNLEKRFDKFLVGKNSPLCFICTLNGICEGFHPNYVKLFTDHEIIPVQSLNAFPESLSQTIRDFLAAKARKEELRVHPESSATYKTPEALVSWGAERIEEAVRSSYQAIRFSFEGHTPCPETIPLLAKMSKAQHLKATFAMDAHFFTDTDSTRRISADETFPITIEPVIYAEEKRNGLKGVLNLLAHGFRANLKVVELVSDQDSDSLITTLRFCHKLNIPFVAFEYRRGHLPQQNMTKENVAAAVRRVLKVPDGNDTIIELRGFPFDFFPDLHFLYKPPYYDDRKDTIL
jgi:pyruvate-formate lyase-activating enzyme